MVLQNALSHSPYDIPLVNHLFFPQKDLWVLAKEHP
ncbi:Putative protein [Zobellia galactanivorans]|uniref:Uncharacterized protein n=1 Tax=Zobellia galactanivorans (strain DSM 12802 / CCUG 47099 / CIP 106680 / NCIMB 13871 / Dsij) TaxID=63186 RepID=G0L0R4_ZOBGA|nr:Putative protein [Zobellia galactanivorans]